MKSSLKVAFLNAENLFVLSRESWEELSVGLTEKKWQAANPSFVPNKPLAKLRRLALTLDQLDLDLVFLCEVGGLESLSNFNRWFLGDRYDPVLLEGNSDRNIDLAVMVRRTDGVSVRVQSHRHRLIPLVYPHEKVSLETGYGHLHKDLGRRKFARDVLQVEVFFKERLAANFLVVHLKSKREVLALDPLARNRRQAEVEALVDIYTELQKNSDVPAMVCGDFNGKAWGANYEEEFKALHERSDLIDVLEVMGVREEDRYTFIRRNWRKVNLVALDYFFVGEKWATHVQDAYVHRYPSPPGFLDSPGKVQTLRESWPSDHCPIVLHLQRL